MKLSTGVLDKIRGEYGEAFYLLDSVQFRENFCELKNIFSNIYPYFNIAYSYKTNYIPRLCKIVNYLGGYAEVVSEMEVELAMKIGVDPRKIIWNGPIKNLKVVEDFLLQGGTVNIDSLEEAESVRSIAEKHGEHELNIGVRCNFDIHDGVLSRFGVDIDSRDFVKVFDCIKNAKNIKLVDLHCHFAKRQIEYWPARAEGMIDIIDRIGIIPERVDLGGGIFGKMEDSLKEQFTFFVPSYADYAEAVASIFAKRFENMTNGPELLIEPGSALVGDCMKFVGTIKTIKSVRGKNIASVLGSQKNISMSGVNPPLEVFAMGKEQQEYEDIDFVGFTCIETDTLYKGYSGNLACGDMVVISNCGSYSLVMKPPFILPNFPVLDISSGEIEMIKRGETFDDVFCTFCF